MKKNRLGKSDIWVSEIGFGCMSIGTDKGTGIRLIHEALDHGINFLDTSDLYDRGKNEEIVGAAIQGRRQDVILATKVGNRWKDGSEGWEWDPTKVYIKQAVKGSLKRLNTEYIDLYQLHGGTIEDPIEETIEAFEELKQEGVIREYGISSIRPNVIREYVRRSHIVSVMMQYSILDRRPEEEILSLLQQHQIHVIARGPLAKGFLSAKIGERRDKGFQDYSFDEIKILVNQLEQLTNESRAVSQLALRYVLAHPAVATVIPGASRPEQLAENIAATMSQDLSVTEVELIQRWTRANTYQVHR
jgi:1-deoxyxylulose-5-phosphate synthase